MQEPPQQPPSQSPAPQAQPSYGQPPYLPQQPPQGARAPLYQGNNWFGRQTRTAQIVMGVVGLLVVCCLCGGIAAAMNGGKSSTDNTQTSQQSSSTATNTPSATNTSAPTATATPRPQPKTVLDMSGNGIKQSNSFRVGGHGQQLTWSCDPASFQGYAFNVQIFVYNADTNQTYLADAIPVNAMCGKDSGQSTGDTTSLHWSSGNYYIKVNSEGAWHVTITDMP